MRDQASVVAARVRVSTTDRLDITPRLRSPFPPLGHGNGSHARYHDQEASNFLSNNYRGEQGTEVVAAAVVDATRAYGVGVTGSRLACGKHDLHDKPERALAELSDVSDALVFTTGYAGARLLYGRSSNENGCG